MSELKPCPFCDGPATYVTVLKIAGDYSAAVICERCNAKTDFMRANDEEDAKVMAAACWNARAERTCIPHVEPRALTVDTEPSFYQAICECGWIVGEDGTSNLSEFEHVDSYCGCCGARVVVE